MDTLIESKDAGGTSSPRPTLAPSRPAKTIHQRVHSETPAQIFYASNLAPRLAREALVSGETGGDPTNLTSSSMSARMR